jgi:hypothetical protein
MLNLLLMNPKPDFINGQVLKKDDLNAIINYLEPQVRATNVSLIGAGIFYGLKIEPGAAANQIIVRKGAGVSSEGILFFLENDVTFYFEQQYLTSPTAQTGFDLTVLNQHNNLPTVNALKWTTAESDVTLPGVDLSKFCFLLYFENEIKGDTSCFATFNQTGNLIHHNLKLLALSEADLNSVWTTVKNPGSSGNPIPVKFPYVNRLPVWALVKDKSPLQNVTWVELRNKYIELCEAALFGTGTNGDGTVTETLRAVLQSDFDATLKNLADSFDGTTNELQLQYLHDYLKDLVAAYEEWALTRPQERKELWCPNTTEFPKFVAIGKLPLADGAVAADDCRMPRYYPGIPGDLNVPQADPLLERLKFMATRANLDFFSLANNLDPNHEGIKITGSRRKCPPLSEQAIPYYYKNNAGLRLLWNPAMTAAGRTQAIPSYFPHPSPTQKPFDQPLYYDLEQFDFYRVEGHVGKSLTEGFTAICNLRNELNLPFDIVLVRVGPTVDFTNIPDDPKVEEAITDMNFTQFAKNHPGMEHMGGVPRGGTLVLIYKEDEFKTGEIKEVRNPNGEVFFILTRPDLPRTIVADFCLPYSCFKGPNIEYIIKETSDAGELVADFDKVSHDFEAEQDDKENLQPMAIVRLENRSINAEEYEWKIEKLLGDGTVQTTPSPDVPLILKENLVEIQKVKVTLTAKRSGTFAATKSVSKEINLCPSDLSFFIEFPSGSKSLREEVAVQFDAGKPVQLNLQFSLPGGGRFLFLDPKNSFNTLAIFSDETEKTVRLNLPSDIKPDTYTVRLATSCTGLERQVRITIADPQRPDDDIIARSTGGRREEFLANVEAVSDSTLKATSAHKRTVAFLTLPHLAVEKAVTEFEGVARLLFGSIGKPGGATDEQYITLLRNATWGLLDKAVAISPAAMPAPLQTALESLVPALQKAKVDVNELRKDWKSKDLKTGDNTKTIKAIETILKT